MSNKNALAEEQNFTLVTSAIFRHPDPPLPPYAATDCGSGELCWDEEPCDFHERERVICADPGHDGQHIGLTDFVICGCQHADSTNGVCVCAHEATDSGLCEDCALDAHIYDEVKK